jgi:predicted nucleic acid-binding protein
VADTSAWARADLPPVAESWKQAAAADEIVGCPVVTLELLYDAADSSRVEQVAAVLAGLRQAPLTQSVSLSAIWAIRELATRGSAGWHRVRVPDALVAAAAAERGFGVLHYDGHFDRLATVLRFASQWVAPQGSLP